MGNENGWVSKWALHRESGAEALAADSVGRAAMADGFIQNEKVEDATLTATKVTSSFFITGIYGVGLYGTAVYG